MKRDDLLKMLDLNGKEVTTDRDSDEVAIRDSESPTPDPDASPTALALDDWALRRGRDLLAGSDRLQELKLTELEVADFHALAFEPEPRLQERCVDPLRHQFVEQLLQTPDYQALHRITLLNEAASTLAMNAFAEQFAKLRDRDRAPAKEEEPDRDMETLRSVGKALIQARDEVEEMKEAALAMGMGEGAVGSNDPQTIAELYRRVRGSPTLRKICQLAGRYRRLAQSRQRQKTVHGHDDVVGVVTDGDVSRLLPSELAKLSIPEFEEDTLRRLIERQTLCRDYRGTEPVGKGPILVSVDESGSMEGRKIHTAKALALALAWIARQQRRWCGLVAYSGNSGERLLALPPGRWNEGALMDWLEGFLGRGSDLDVPVRELPDYYRQLQAPQGQTDVILITDALCRIPQDLGQQFNIWKAHVQARVLSLIIHHPPGDLVAISDEVHSVATLGVSETGVERVLSI